MPQSAQVYLVASASKNNATGSNRNQFCFAPVADFALDAAPSSISDSERISLTLKDGGDGVRIPFIPVTATSTVTSRNGGSEFDIESIEVDINPENQKQQTDINGNASAAIVTNCDVKVCRSGDSAVVTFRAGDAAVEVNVKIP